MISRGLTLEERLASSQVFDSATLADLVEWRFALRLDRYPPVVTKCIMMIESAFEDVTGRDLGNTPPTDTELKLLADKPAEVALSRAMFAVLRTYRENVASRVASDVQAALKGLG